jgi:hypothetical protein
MGTAGHVDHGKTALIKALTGIECDTHKEEKERGITITAKQIKNKTITTGKLAPATVAALQGAQGPRGVEGDKGATGIKGDTGIPGIAGPEVVTSFNADNSANVAANSNGDIVSMNGLPSNRYLVIAKSIMFAQTGGALLTCGIETNPGGNGDDAQWNSPAKPTNPWSCRPPAVTQIKVNTDHLFGGQLRCRCRRDSIG